MNSKIGLEPWVGISPKILILGTIPSNLSIKTQEYYSNPNNSFWKLIYNLSPQQENFNKKEYITSLNIALWDCAKYGISTKGNADKDLISASLQPNDIVGFLKQYPTITTIVLNGKSKGSEKKPSTPFLFTKWFAPNISNKYKVLALQSTSNNNSKCFNSKLEEWKCLKYYL